MTIARQAVAPLLLVLACAACGLGEDPLAGSSVGSASWTSGSPRLNAEPSRTRRDAKSCRSLRSLPSWSRTARVVMAGTEYASPMPKLPNITRRHARIAP